MVNFTIIGFKEIIEHNLERKQLALLVALDFYFRTSKRVLKKQICKEASILPESFSRAVKRLNDYGLLGEFSYNNQTKHVSNSFKLNKTKSLHIQVPTYLIKVGALTNNALAVFGYLKAMPKGEWNGSCYKLHQKINVWFVKHKIKFSLSLTSVYKAIKILQTLKLIDKFQQKFMKDNKWWWIIKISINAQNLNQILPIFDYYKDLLRLTIRPFESSKEWLWNENMWAIFD